MKFYSDYFASRLIPDRNFLKLHTNIRMQLHYVLLQIHTNKGNNTLFFWKYNGLWVILNISARYAFIGPKNLNYLTWQLFGFERTRWRLFQKRVVSTTFDIYVFIKSNTFKWAGYNIFNITFFWYNRCFGLFTCPCDLISWFKTNAKCAFKGEVRITKD